MQFDVLVSHLLLTWLATVVVVCSAVDTFDEAPHWTRNGERTITLSCRRDALGYACPVKIGEQGTRWLYLSTLSGISWVASNERDLSRSEVQQRGAAERYSFGYGQPINPWTSSSFFRAPLYDRTATSKGGPTEEFIALGSPEPDLTASEYPDVLISHGLVDSVSLQTLRDSVGLGPVTIPYQTLGASTKVDGFNLLRSRVAQGLLGLGTDRPFDSVIGAHPSVFGNLASSLKQPIFTINFADGLEGILEFGKVDTDKISGPLKNIPLGLEAGASSFEANAVFYVSGNAEPVHDATVRVIFDPLFETIEVPANRLGSVLNQMGFPQYLRRHLRNWGDSAVWELPCDLRVPDLVLVLGGETEITIPGENLKRRRHNGQVLQATSDTNRKPVEATLRKQIIPHDLARVLVEIGPSHSLEDLMNHESKELPDEELFGAV
ncbi:MAG: hypothetical protein M1833_005452 [Piccolia ochrophora]|nr:MAG: hypothetical protein M1833_005452 [Piccolia ochrophora]